MAKRPGCAGVRRGAVAAQIATIAFTSEGGAREVTHNFNADRFDSLAPSSWATSKFTARKEEIKKTAMSGPQDHDLHFSSWNPLQAGQFHTAAEFTNDALLGPLELQPLRRRSYLMTMSRSTTPGPSRLTIEGS